MSERLRDIRRTAARIVAEGDALFKPVGRWLAKYGEAVYGKVDRALDLEWTSLGNCTRKGNTIYFWSHRWPGSEIVLAGFKSKLKKASLLHNGKAVRFTQKGSRA